MTHSATMTIDQRHKLSVLAWILAAICGLGLMLSASLVVNAQTRQQLPQDSNYKIQQPYGYVTQGNNS